MLRLAAALIAASVACAAGGAAPAAAQAPAMVRRGAYGAMSGAVLIIDGERTRVRWSDGDSFKMQDGPLRGRAARLVGVNALETFGPVHRLGAASPEELLVIARGTAALAAAREWRCTANGGADGYGRLLVSCPDAAEALVRAGHAMAFAVGAKADARLVAAQREAQQARAGMWAKGAPPLVPTSLHSADEPSMAKRGAYDRIADTRTGVTSVVRHERVYATCEEVCVGDGEARACMIYVPFERRYRGKPACIAGKRRR